MDGGVAVLGISHLSLWVSRPLDEFDEMSRHFFPRRETSELRMSVFWFRVHAGLPSPWFRNENMSCGEDMKSCRIPAMWYRCPSTKKKVYVLAVYPRKGGFCINLYVVRKTI